MFYCVYIGNSKVSNTARDVHWGVKKASRVQKRQFSKLNDSLSRAKIQRRSSYFKGIRAF